MKTLQKTTGHALNIIVLLLLLTNSNTVSATTYNVSGGATLFFLGSILTLGIESGSYDDSTGIGQWLISLEDVPAKVTLDQHWTVDNATGAFDLQPAVNCATSMHEDLCTGLSEYFSGFDWTLENTPLGEGDFKLWHDLDGYSYYDAINLTLTPVPAPASVWLFISAFTALFGVRKIVSS